MSQTKEVRYTSQSITPPPRGRSRSRSSSRSRGRSRSRSQDSKNPGNNLYVTGLSTRVTSSDLEKYFSKEGRVQECNVVLDPRTKESRGFAFVTMETVEDARRCIKYLHRTVLEGRLISIEKRVMIIYRRTSALFTVKDGFAVYENTQGLKCLAEKFKD